MAPPLTDKTNYAQSLMHMIKGNLGTGILAMPISFKNIGLVVGAFGLPLLCLIATLCVHLLVRSSQHLETKLKIDHMDYAALAKGAFKAGPTWMRPFSGPMCKLVDGVLIVSQVGICCVYVVFMAENLMKVVSTSDEANNHNHIAWVFLALIPFVVAISWIRTLRRLAIASACANVLQVFGLCVIVYNLIMEMPDHFDFEPVGTDIALGFGSAMFAFEGISVVLPIYSRMKKPEQMGGCLGIVNVSYVILLILYTIIGVLGYLCYGSKVQGSLTLNLPQGSLSRTVQIIFAVSIFLTYPLQFYVPNEIIWNWVKERIGLSRSLPTSSNRMVTGVGASSTSRVKSSPPTSTQPEVTAMVAAADASESTSDNENSDNGARQQRQSTRATQHPITTKLSHNNASVESTELAAATSFNNTDTNTRQQEVDLKYDYLFRTLLVLFTFVLAITIPQLDLLMGLVGSLSGCALSITLPAIIHMAAFWEDTSGSARVAMIVVDSSLIIISFVAGASGSFKSIIEIINTF